MSKASSILLSSFVVVASVYLYAITRTAPRLSHFPLNRGNTNVSYGSRPLDSTEIRPFVISIAESVLADLKARLVQARLPRAQVSGITWQDGASSAYLKDLIEYWEGGFDWRAQEKRLNEEMPQFHTDIDGLAIHFAHIKADRSVYAHVAPLLLIHGWPGSFMEFQKVVAHLTRPENKEDLAFDLVIPSLPGFGFSDAPTKRGVSVTESAAIFVKLMARLGYSGYIVQGGDWGSFVSVAVAQQDEANCAGIHLNWFPGTGSPILFPFRVLGSFIAPEFILPKQRDREKIFPIGRVAKELVESVGYLLLQSTKPDTLGYALSDSPVGLAAWITEKFHGWSYHANPEEVPFSKDELLTNIMIYWLNSSASSSVRFYREFYQSLPGLMSAGSQVSLPTGLADFKKDLMRTPAPWVGYKYLNVVSLSEFDVGGHFAALEEPLLLSKDIRQFATKVRSKL